MSQSNPPPFKPPEAQDRLDRAHRENLDPYAFRLLYAYVQDNKVTPADDMALRLGISRNKARAAQRTLEEQGYIHRTRRIAGNIHYTELGFISTTVDDWGDFWCPSPDDYDPDGELSESNLEAPTSTTPTLAIDLTPTAVINTADFVTNCVEDVTNAVTSDKALPRDDKGRYVRRSAAPQAATRTGLRNSCSSEARGKYSYPTGTHSTTPLRGVARSPKNIPSPTEDETMIRTMPSSDFESPVRSDFGDVEAPAPDRPKRQPRGEVYRVKTSRPTDRRHDKAPSDWTGGDLAAEFGSLVSLHCPDLYDATNFAKVRGAICHKVKAGADPAELKMILEMFFADPRNTRPSGIPIWRRFLASLPGYQANAMLALGKIAPGADPVSVMSATPTEETEAFNRATMDRIRALRSVS